MWRAPGDLSIDDDGGGGDAEVCTAACEAMTDRRTEMDAAALDLISAMESEVGPEGAELILKLAEGMSFTEIAQEEGVSPQAVWNRVKRLQKRLAHIDL
jgi:DNA-directed RNA polymerase specialized sigma24 family protein